MSRKEEFFRLVPVQIPEKLTGLLQPKRFKVIHGGRGSAKSHTVAQLLLVIGDQSTKRILCVRETQSSIKESSHALLKHYIAKLGLTHRYDVQANQIVNRVTGTVFTFIGLREHSAESIKSYEGYDIAWVEEAQSVGGVGMKMLIDTVRKDDSEIWFTFNPTRGTDYVYDRFVANKDEDALVIEMNWRDNPWFTKANNIERLKDKKKDHALYEHIWEGKLRSTGGIIFKRDWFKYYYPHEKPSALRLYGASDFATVDAVATNTKPDWTEFGVAGLDEYGNFFFVDWWSGQEDPSVWVSRFVDIVKRNEPGRWFEEKGVILRALDSTISRLMRKRGVHVLRTPLASAGSKADRALGFAALCAEGMVYLPLNKDGSKPAWVERLVNQLCEFSGSPNDTDDMVDVCSLLARGLKKMSNAVREDDPRRKEAPAVGSRAHTEHRVTLDSLDHDTYDD
jgi:phage terminase large subunit-like protein